MAAKGRLIEQSIAYSVNQVDYSGRASVVVLYGIPFGFKS